MVLEIVPQKVLNVLTSGSQLNYVPEKDVHELDTATLTLSFPK
jgi:hypothetical protein